MGVEANVVAVRAAYICIMFAGTENAFFGMIAECTTQPYLGKKRREIITSGLVIWNETRRRMVCTFSVAKKMER